MMMVVLQAVIFLLLITKPAGAWMPARLEVDVLLDVKAALDPHGAVLVSWQAGGRPCSGAFEGVLCDTAGRVTNISLQGRSLAGFIPDALSELSALSGVFLHFNDLRGSIPASLSSLAALTDLYLNRNQLSGPIPTQLGQLSSLQVLELSSNRLDGEIPVELTNLSNLETLAVNANILNGTIPATISDMAMLTRLDVSHNALTGNVPETLANLPNLDFLDVSHNLLSGPVPTGLLGLGQGFRYSNNSALCATGRSDMAQCASAPSPNPSPTESASSKLMSIATAIAFAIGGSGFLVFVFICLRRRNANLMRSHVFESSSDIRTAARIRATGEKRVASIADSFSRCSTGREWSMSLDELETATNYFSEQNLLQRKKDGHTAVYKGTLRDGTPVAVKAIYNTRHSFADFQTAIEALTHVKHENLVAFLGFCCSKGGSECFLVYAFVPDASLNHLLHGHSEGAPLTWKLRVNIIRCIAKGLAHLHEGSMVHQNLWAGNVLVEKQSGRAVLADYGQAEIVAEEVMYATHKTQAARGSLAPEYAQQPGVVTEDCDIYAFGALVLQLVTGVVFQDHLRHRHECMDLALGSTAGLVRLALQCMASDPGARPSMMDVVVECEKEWMAMADDSQFLAAATALVGRPQGASFSHDCDARHPCR